METINTNNFSNSFYQKQLPLAQEGDLHKKLDIMLRELRETLHRRGRLSSRSEALDEVCKLLFAHVMSISNEGRGISREAVFNGSDPDREIASHLKMFVDHTFSRYLPSSLSHEISHQDFELKLKPQEDTLADEIISCFERFAPRSGFGNVHDLSSVDLLNDVFGKFLVDSFVDEKQLGQYLTPSEVVKFMVQLAIQDMSPNELELLCNPDLCNNFGLILDPSCGTASFLTELLKVLCARLAHAYTATSITRWLENMVTNVIVGIDKSERMLKLALTNVAMFGLPAAKLHLANSLARFGDDAEITKSLEGKVRLILTNPPFGAEFEGKDLSRYKIATNWSQRRPKTVVSELLLMERYLDWLAPGGQCLVVVPDSILTNKGLYEDLRIMLADKIEIRSVISLPPVTFSAAGTSTKTSILHFRKPLTHQSVRDATFFAICQDIGYAVATRETQKTKIANGNSDLPMILKAFIGQEVYSNFGRRVLHAEKSIRWDANYHASLSIEIEQRIDNPLPSDVFVADIAQLSSERCDPRKFQKETFEYIEISDIDPRTCIVHTKTVPCVEAPSRARKVVHTGDVLFSTVRPDRRVVGVVREDQDGAICTTGFAVLRPRNIDPLTLAYILKTDFVIAQVLRNNIGIAYPAVEESCLPGILIPMSRNDLAFLSFHSKTILALEKQVQETREKFFKEVNKTVHTNLIDPLNSTVMVRKPLPG